MSRNHTSFNKAFSLISYWILQYLFIRVPSIQDKINDIENVQFIWNILAYLLNWILKLVNLFVSLFELKTYVCLMKDVVFLRQVIQI